jgi:hypothetical protein
MVSNSQPGNTRLSMADARCEKWPQVYRWALRLPSIILQTSLAINSGGTPCSSSFSTIRMQFENGTA